MVEAWLEASNMKTDKTTPEAPSGVLLREVVPADLEEFFQHQRDPDARWMAAFTSKDPDDHDAFMAHWKRILTAPEILTRTIEVAGKVAGSIASYVERDRREVTYWVGKEYWGKGVATKALRDFVHEEHDRPLHARAAADNVASLRVLEKCGFHVVGESRGFAHGRGQEIDELVLRLE